MVGILLAAFCLAIPLVIVAVIVFVIQQSKRGPTPQQRLYATEELLNTWIKQGKLSNDEAAPILRLIAAELTPPATVPSQTTPQVASIHPPIVTSHVAEPATVASETPATVLDVLTQEPTPSAASIEAPVVEAIEPAVVAMQPPIAETVLPVTPLAETPQPAASEPKQRWTQQLWAGFLALRTRQVLLFLGTFLLFMSSLVLVIFNWASFPVFLQCALLAILSGMFWAGGEWLERQMKLERAGSGLRAVGGVLAPVAAFACARALSLDLHQSWLVVSAICVGLYALAARRTKQQLFAAGTGIALSSTVIAAIGFASWSAVPAALVLMQAVVLLPLQAMRRHDKATWNIAWYIMVLVVPVSIVVSAGMWIAQSAPLGWFSASLFGSTVFYGMLAWQEQRRSWMWATALLMPCAVLTGCFAALPQYILVPWFVLIGCLFGYRLLAVHQRVDATVFAPILKLAAQLLMPLAILGGVLYSTADLFYNNNRIGLPGMLWAASAYYALIVFQGKRARWMAASLLFVSVAIVTSLYLAWPEVGSWGQLILPIMAISYFLLSVRLGKSQWPMLGIPPRLLAHGLAALTLLFAALMVRSSSDLASCLAWSIVLFSVLVVAVERKAGWLWVPLLLAPCAVVCTLLSMQVPLYGLLITIGVFALAYSLIAVVGEPRLRLFAQPVYGAATVVAGVLVLSVASIAQGSFEESLLVARWTLPMLACSALAVLFGSHRQRLAWLAEAGRELVAAVMLVLIGVSGPLWLWFMLDLTTIATEWRALILLPLGTIGFVLAASRFGQLRPMYRPVLEMIASALAVIFAATTLFSLDTAVWGLALLTVTWLLQTFFRRNAVWSSLLLSTAIATLSATFLRLEVDEALWWLAFAALVGFYTIGGTLLRRSSWRSLTLPALILGGLIGLVQVAFITQSSYAVSLPMVASLLILSATAAVLVVQWRQPVLGYLPAALAFASALLAARQGFFFTAALDQRQFAILLCALATLGVTMGQAIRLRDARYALPIEHISFALLPAALVLAGFDSRTATLTWAATGLLGLFAVWRYRTIQVLSVSLLALSIAATFGAGWLFPGGDPVGAGLVLAVSAGICIALAWWPRRWRAYTQHHAALAAGIDGLLALLVVSLAPGSMVFAQTVLLLCAFVAIHATLSRNQYFTWPALGLLAVGLAAVHSLIGLDVAWNIASGTCEALLLALIGWAFDRWASRFYRSLEIWRLPLLMLPPSTAIGLCIGLASPSWYQNSQALLFSLIVLALLFASMAVRLRDIRFAYAAGGALVLGTLLQFTIWQLRDLQWYVLPASVYLLALAEGLRRFQGQRRVSQLIETGALALMLGTLAMRAVQLDGAAMLNTTAVLVAESLILLLYGVVRQLRMPFFGGAIGFVFGVIWLSIDPLMATNKWILLGVLGLIMVVAYVVLEQRQEQLTRTGRALITRIGTWR